MINSKLLKVKKWVDLNEAAQRLSLALDEPVNALDLLELALEGELILSVKLPLDKKFLASKRTEINTPMIDYYKRMFTYESYFLGEDVDTKSENYLIHEMEYIKEKHRDFLNSPKNTSLTDEQKTFHYFCNSLFVPEFYYEDLEYLGERVFELTMQGSEKIDVMWLIHKNKKLEMNELTNIDGVLLQGSDGFIYNLQEKFDEEYISCLSKNEKEQESKSMLRFTRKYRLNPRHYFPAGSLPEGSEIGMSPSNMSNFELKLSGDESDYHNSQVLLTLGAVLKEVTKSGARKWTQGDLSSIIGDKKIASLGERVVNGIFSDVNKSMKSIN